MCICVSVRWNVGDIKGGLKIKIIKKGRNTHDLPLSIISSPFISYQLLLFFPLFLCIILSFSPSFSLFLSCHLFQLCTSLISPELISFPPAICLFFSFFFYFYYFYCSYSQHFFSMYFPVSHLHLPFSLLSSSCFSYLPPHLIVYCLLRSPMSCCLSNRYSPRCPY